MPRKRNLLNSNSVRMKTSTSKTYSIFYLPGKKQFVRYERPRVGYLQYKNFRIDLLTGKRLNIGAEQLLREYKHFFPLQEPSLRPRVMHFFYEFGYVTQELYDLVSETTLLALILEYESFEFLDGKFQYDIQLQEDLELLEFPDRQKYRLQFERCQSYLKNGDCYQLNLTAPFYFRLPTEISKHEEFLSLAWGSLERLGAYAHCTYIDEINKMYFSNSPECLFNIRSSQIYSMPIKGTKKVQAHSQRAKAWKELSSCAKNQAELFMITDLIRNDLTKIQLIPAKVLASRLPLHVPGIVHQYSVVAAPATNSVSLEQLLRGLFPGGSITGAPKKKVMRLLRELEPDARGFYCGSTFVFHKDLMAGSINIRSSEVDFTCGEVKYCAGGGITLESQCEDEYDELCAKMKSFLLLLKQ